MDTIGHTPLQVTPEIVITPGEIQESFVLAGGPGGQNVNKVATSVQLRFDAKNAPALTPEVFNRLVQLAGSRMTRQGEILIEARRFRSRERNRADARERLVTLIQQALIRPKTRRATRPSRASKERRLEAKRRQSQRKVSRRGSGDGDY
ncbi:MAG: aminoacyl-tRNA hydrolase [Magnetococcales bacterium]|nr:aminoacyl-tRNA hydrolase [Magnetococcales bacterium]